MRWSEDPSKIPDKLKEHGRHFRDRIDVEILPYIKGETDADRALAAGQVAEILDWNDDEVIKLLQSKSESGHVCISEILDIDKWMKNGQIDNTASWFTRLEQKMLKFNIYLAGTSDADLKGAEEAARKADLDFAEKLRKSAEKRPEEE